MVNISMCYSNQTIINMYWHYRKLVYKIIVNGGGYRITYFVAGYWNNYPVASYKITYSVATLSYDNYYVNLWDYNNFFQSNLL